MAAVVDRKSTAGTRKKRFQEAEDLRLDLADLARRAGGVVAHIEDELCQSVGEGGAPPAPEWELWHLRQLLVELAWARRSLSACGAGIANVAASAGYRSEMSRGPGWRRSPEQMVE